KLVTAGGDKDKLKQHGRTISSTDGFRVYKKLSKEHGHVKERYSHHRERFDEYVKDYNELLEEDKSLNTIISDVTRDGSLMYKRNKEFRKERTDGLKVFKNVFKWFVDEVKDKIAQFQVKHDLEPKKNEVELTHNREVKKERSRDQGMSYKIKKAPEKVSFFEGFELVFSFLDSYYNNKFFFFLFSSRFKFWFYLLFY